MNNHWEGNILETEFFKIELDSECEAATTTGKWVMYANFMDLAFILDIEATAPLEEVQKFALNVCEAWMAIRLDMIRGVRQGMRQSSTSSFSPVSGSTGHSPTFPVG